MSGEQAGSGREAHEPAVGLPLAAGAERPLRILHVTEALGGGIITSLRSILQAADQHHHELVYAERGSFNTAEALVPPFLQAFRVDGGPAALWRHLRGELVERPPDVVHAHSAWAGLVARTQFGLGAAVPPVVYSPHSYYFERTNLSRPVRWTAQLIERLLARRTAVAACVSPYEVALSVRLGLQALPVPNVITLDATGLRPTPAAPSARPHFGTVGRLAPQKDPSFFRDVVRVANRSGLTADWTWIGGGEADVRELLEAEGVRVTGWLPRDEVLAELKSMSAYVHTASWEGSPMTLLEAAALDLPIVARSIDALKSLGFPADLDTPEDLVAALARLVETGEAPDTPSPATTDEQRRALSAVYATARGR